MDVSSILIPLLLSGISLWALRENMNVYDALADGALAGLQILLRIFPHLLVLLTALAMFRASGALDMLTQWLRPALEWLGIPPETASLVLLRPLSGSGGLAIGSELITAYGPDSTVGRTAAVMLGSSETTFYTVAVYFGAAGIKQLRHTLAAALIADIAGFLAAAWCIKWFF